MLRSCVCPVGPPWHSSRCSRCSVRRVTEPPIALRPLRTRRPRPSRPRAQPAAAKAIKGRSQEGETEGQDADRIDRHGGRRSDRSGPSRPGARLATARQLFGRANDWEPATAADPSAPVRLRPDDPVLRQGARCRARPAISPRWRSGRRATEVGRSVRSGTSSRTSREGSSTRSSPRTAPATSWRAGWTGSRGSCSRSRPITEDVDARSGRVARSRMGRSSVARRQSERPARLHRLQPRGELGGAVARRRVDVAPRAADQHRGSLLLRERHGGDGRRERGDLDRELRAAVLDGRAAGADPGRGRAVHRRGRDVRLDGRRHRPAASWLRERRLSVQPLRRTRRDRAVRGHARARVRRRGSRTMGTSTSGFAVRPTSATPGPSASGFPPRRPAWWR